MINRDMSISSWPCLIGFRTLLLVNVIGEPLAVFGRCCYCSAFVICALFAPWLAPQDPPSSTSAGACWRRARPLVRHRRAGPRHPLAHALRRPHLADRCDLGGLALARHGLIAGLAAGFYGGWTDTVLNVYVTNAFLALPGILLAIAFVAFLGPGLFNLILALSISGWVGYARLVRAQVMAVKEREFVEAARALGASDLRVLCRHILPNIVQPLIVQAAIGMAGAVLAEATLSFLGLGVPPPAASWGSMLNDGRSHLFDSPHLVVFPAMPSCWRCSPSTSSATRCATSSTRERG
jgi:peptide/nickel transport system permease protein